jgi:hypothetical protein
MTVAALQLHEIPLPDLIVRNNWSAPTIRGFWALGYRCSDILNIFESVPQYLGMVICRMFGDLEMKASQANCARSLTTSAKCEPVAVQMRADAELWESSDTYGFLQVFQFFKVRYLSYSEWCLLASFADIF